MGALCLGGKEFVRAVLGVRGGGEDGGRRRVGMGLGLRDLGHNSFRVTFSCLDYLGGESWLHTCNLVNRGYGTDWVGKWAFYCILYEYLSVSL